MLSAKELIEILDLQPHPEEGGFFRETYRATEQVQPHALPERYGSSRCFCTAIYYLLTPGTYSRMHRVRSDEIFHFYLGDPVSMLWLSRDRGARTLILGSDLEQGQIPQVVVPQGAWQGCCLKEGGEVALLGCTVAPGFEYLDYESGKRDELLRSYPLQKDLILRLTPA